MAADRSYRMSGNLVVEGGGLAGGSAPAQFLRFLACGGMANLAYAGLFLVLADVGAQLANVVGALVSAALADELHRRLTFRAHGRVGWRTAQWQGGLTLAAAVTASGSALLWLDAATADADPLVPLLVAVAVNGSVGLLRFVVLRRLFSRPAAARTAGSPRPPGGLRADRPVAALAA